MEQTYIGYYLGLRQFNSLFNHGHSLENRSDTETELDTLSSV